MGKKLLSKIASAFTGALLILLAACGDDSPADANKKDSGSSGDSNRKVWFVVGDSFSHGDWSGIEPTPTLSTGTYAGYPPVYSYLIGNRANLDVRNIAENGYTLSMREGSDPTNTFTHPKGKLYTTDFSEANIITIYLGINDSYFEVPIGTPDDTDPATFKGAWNTAISYLKEHYPAARIGIIVSNACYSATYPEATVQVAKKWDLPYLDLDGGVNGVTMLLSSSRNPASEEVRAQVLLEQRISETNYHPNPLAHEIESAFIEEWLLSLL